MAVMNAVQVSKPSGPFELVERPIPEPGRGQVRIKVEACGGRARFRVVLTVAS